MALFLAPALCEPLFFLALFLSLAKQFRLMVTCDLFRALPHLVLGTDAALANEARLLRRALRVQRRIPRSGFDGLLPVASLAPYRFDERAARALRDRRQQRAHRRCPYWVAQRLR